MSQEFGSDQLTVVSSRSLRLRCARGQALMARLGLIRYVYLKEKTPQDAWQTCQTWKKRILLRSQSEGKSCLLIPFTDPRDPAPAVGAPSAPYLLQPYSNPSLKWAPRDSMEHACETLSEWLNHGYGEYQLPLSLMGYGSEKPDYRRVKKENPFIVGGFTYLHMSFAKLAAFIRELHPDDRFLCYLIPKGVPVHMYFDLDGDFARFPHLLGLDEECLSEFLLEVQTVFSNTFKRQMDCSGLILLQATSAVKLSWHLHVRTEAFCDVYHLQEFVKRLNRHLQAKVASGVPSLLCHQGFTLVDHVPYMANQNFRAPYNRKPLKTALLPRSFQLKEGRFELKEEALVAGGVDETIDEELLWQCHPALAQPGRGYTYLQLELESAMKKVSGQGLAKRSRPTSSAMTTENRAKRMKRKGNGMSADRVLKQSKALGAVASSIRTLSRDEWEQVVTILRPELGDNVDLYEAVWYRSGRGPICVSGSCVRGTAQCLHQSQLQGKKYTHGSNSMTFMLSSAGEKTFRCFKCDIKAIDGVHSRSHRFPWVLNDNDRVLMGAKSVPISDALAPSADSDRKKRMVAYIESTFQVSRFHPVFDSNHFKSEGCRNLATEQSLFEALVFNGASTVVLDKVKQFDAFWAYHQALDQVEKAASWKKVVQVAERFLDATIPSDSRIRDLFDQETHLVMQSGQGTAKTEVILVELRRLLQRKPKARILWLSNRITYSNSVRDRCAKFDESLASDMENSNALGFRSYKEFCLPKKENSFATEQAATAAKIRLDRVNREMVQCPRLILSLESLHRLTSARSSGGGELLIPSYDAIIMDEVMELHAIFHGSTMEGKRRRALELLTTLASKATYVWAADADVKDEIVLPFLSDITNGKRFSKLWNVQPTIHRRYLNYPGHGAGHAFWRQQLLQQLKKGKKVLLVCSTKKEALSVRDDPDIIALGLSMKIVYGESTTVDRDGFVDSVLKWTTLDLFGYSPVISSGVDFNEEHFDIAFFFASDNSTTVRQAFQQLNRVRKLRDNLVHMYLCVHEKQHQHLPCSYEEIEEKLNDQIREHHGEFYFKLHHCGITGPLKLQTSEKAGTEGVKTCTFMLDSGIPPGGFVRKLFDTAGNRLYIRNQLQINHSRVNFRKEMREAIQETGGTIEEVKDTDVEESYQKELKARAILDKNARQQEIMKSVELTQPQVEVLRARICRNDVRAGDVESLAKVSWKEAYGIPLEDTTRLAAVVDFPNHFGTAKRLNQVRNLRMMVGSSTSAVQVSFESDPIPYLVRESELRKQVQLMMDVIGLSTIWSDARSVNQVQVERLVNDRLWRACILKRFEGCHWKYAAWWSNWKEKQQWKVLESDVVTSAGECVPAKELYRALVIGVRQFLETSFGIRLVYGRLGRDQQRGGYLMLDRSYWNEWCEALFRHPKQDVKIPKGRTKRTVTKTASKCDSFESESVHASESDKVMTIIDQAIRRERPRCDGVECTIPPPGWSFK